MSEHLIWQVGNRNPSITQDIVDTNGAAINLSSSTVQFRMRAINSSALKVDQSATITDAPNGKVRYDWAAADVDTAGDYLVWWVVTTGGKTQDVGEAIIEFRAHAPETHAYVELEEFKSTAQLIGTTHADSDIRAAIVAASRAVDRATGSFFYLGSPGEVRYYSARHRNRLRIDPLVSLTSLATDPIGGTSFGDTWTQNTDFVLEPLNAAADGRPFDHIRVLATGSFPAGFPAYFRSVKLTGQFGWSAIPEGIRTATQIIATRIVKISREAPFGVSAIGPEGIAIRVVATDPIVRSLLEPYGGCQVLA